MSKVCFIINSFDIGGIERVVITLCNGLCKYHQVDLMVLKNRGVLKDTLSSDVTIFDMGGIRVRSIFRPISRYLRKNRPEYIVTSIWLITAFVRLAIIGSRAKSKQIVTHHALFDLENRKNLIADVCTKKSIAYFYNKAFKVFAVSPCVQHFLEETGVRNVQVLYNPFDVERYRRNALKDIGDTRKYGDYFVFVGRLAKVKNVNLILKAFAIFVSDSQFKNYNLLIIGDGPERNVLEENAQRLGISNNCIFLGAMTYPESFIYEAKAVLMASFSEAMPVTVLESLGLNVPVVSTPAPGVLDIFNLLDYQWHTSSFNDADEYCALMKLIISYREKMPDLSALVESNYGLAKILSLWNEVFI